MKRTRGTIGRALTGGVVGSALIGASAIVEGGNDKLGLGLVVGAIFGLMVGFVIGGLVFLRLFRNPVAYLIIGALVGVGAMIVLTNLNSEIEVGNIVDSTYVGLVSGGVIGGIIAVLISRRIALA